MLQCFITCGVLVNMASVTVTFNTTKFLGSFTHDLKVTDISDNREIRKLLNKALLPTESKVREILLVVAK
jgi:hypothetical protein